MAAGDRGKKMGLGVGPEDKVSFADNMVIFKHKAALAEGARMVG